MIADKILMTMELRSKMLTVSRSVSLSTAHRGEQFLIKVNVFAEYVNHDESVGERSLSPSEAFEEKLVSSNYSLNGLNFRKQVSHVSCLVN